MTATTLTSTYQLDVRSTHDDGSIYTWGLNVTLSADHAASSYGVPVLLIAGHTYGPDDVVPASVSGLGHDLDAARLLNLRTGTDPLAERFAAASSARREVAQWGGALAGQVRDRRRLSGGSMTAANPVPMSRLIFGYEICRLDFRPAPGAYVWTRDYRDGTWHRLQWIEPGQVSVSLLQNVMGEPVEVADQFTEDAVVVLLEFQRDGAA